MANLSQQDVVAWLRVRAKRLTDAADVLEEATKGNSSGGTVTLDMIKARLQKGSSRVPQLSKEFGVGESRLRSMIEKKNSGIITQKRGWLKLKGNFNGQKL
jgi:hypothetical protein